MRFVLITLGLTTSFLIAEVVAAIVAGSLALFADAGHMLTDVGALGMSAWAIRLARRPAEGRWTFGLKRAEILSAAVNGLTLVAISLLIGVEAIQRLISPQKVTGGLILATALLGVVINIFCTWTLSKANRNGLNMRAIYAHVLTDLYAFFGTSVAGLVIIVTNWTRADSIASLFVVILMLRTAWGLLRDSGRILLQGVPDNLDLNEVRDHLLKINHVLEVHDLHAWTVTSGLSTLSAHVVLEAHCFNDGLAPQILDSLQRCLLRHFQIEHATFQLEPATHVTHESGLHP